MIKRVRVNFYEDVALEKYPGLDVVGWEIVNSDNDDIIKLTLMTQDGVYVRGNRKGHPKYDRRTAKTVYVHINDAREKAEQWLANGGKCLECLDKGAVCVGAGVDGTRYRICDFCGDGSGVEIRIRKKESGDGYTGTVIAQSDPNAIEFEGATIDECVRQMVESRRTMGV